MFAIPIFLRRYDGENTLYRGSLVNLPVELTTKVQEKFYLDISNDGWFIDDLGYSVYSKSDTLGNRIVVPGIILQDGSKHKKIYGYSTKFTKDQIEDFVSGIIEFENLSFEKASQDLNVLIHDLRNVSTTIYNAAIEARNFIYRENYKEAAERVKNVIAAQTILKIRTDLLDFLGNPASLIRQSPISIYRKIDKIRQTLEARASAKQIGIEIEGSSHRTCFGPELFEIVPFVILENAVKYSPNNEEIRIHVIEESGKIICTVKSLGPEITWEEQERIFEKGFRGASAKSSGISGTGLGLHVVKMLVEDFYFGTINVSQPKLAPIKRGLVDYYQTTFEFHLPIHNYEDEVFDGEFSSAIS